MLAHTVNGISRSRKARWRKLALGLLGAVLVLGLGVYAALPAPSRPLPADAVVSRMVVDKTRRRLMAYAADGTLLKTYRVALGQQPVGAKQVEGDLKTPEGHYTIDSKNAGSQYHKNLGVSYPSAADRARAKKLGKPPGGAIKIHGLPNGAFNFGRIHAISDWTWGCIAVTNDEVDELFRAVPVGTPIEIKP